VEQDFFSRRSQHNGFVRYQRADYLLTGRVLAIVGADVLKVWTASGISRLRLLDLSAAELFQRRSRLGRLKVWLRLAFRKVVVQVVGRDSNGRLLARLWRDGPDQTDPQRDIARWFSDNPVCPDCGSDMLLRQVRSGPSIGTLIWGCSTFPRCEAIRHTN